MPYDKNSFLSGIAVGRQLKGWGRAQPDEPRPRMYSVLETVREFSVAATVDNTMADHPVAVGWLSMGEVVEFSAVATISGGLPGTVGVQASMEVQ